MSADTFGQLVLEHKSRAKPGRRDHLTFRGNTSQGRHAWLRLTPAYSLHVVQEILDNSPKNSLVLDPFSGTGTTPLVSASLGIPCHSVDINPFLVWLGNLKVASFAADVPEILRNAAKRVVTTLRRRRRTKTSWTPDLHQIEKWWDADTLKSLANVFEEVGKNGNHTDEAVRGLLKMAFCRVMIQTAHVSFGHQSMSFKKRTSNNQKTLFDATALANPAEEIYRGFLATTESIASSLDENQPKAEATVFLGDSRNLTKVLLNDKYSIVLTSPPYPNRMSYIRELRPYMYWLGFLETGRQAGELDWQAIGGTWGCATSQLNTWEPNSENKIPYRRFRSIVAAIEKDHLVLGRYVHKYFEDIKQHIEELRSVLAPKAKCYYVVGNSKFYDTLLPVEKIYASLFEGAGFTNVRIETIRKRTSKKELFEYLVYAEME